MLRLFRFWCGALLVHAGAFNLFSATPPAAAAPAAQPDANALPPELQAELDALQRGGWHPSVNARTSLGWRDNVLLSPFAPIERGFARGEIEAILMRPMRDRWEVISFLNGDVLRYFSPPPETGGEQQWSLHGEGRWQPVTAARLSLKGAAYLRDMVIDLSETETRRVVAPTRVRGGYVTAATRWTTGKFSVEPSFQVKRTDYRDYAGDYDEARSGGRVEWRPAGALTLTAGWHAVQRSYDERTEFSASGRERPGTRLHLRQEDGELKARTGWSAGGDWTLIASVGRLENRDRASGYFDYNQKRARLETDFSSGGWRVSVDATAKRVDYLGQTVGAGIAPPRRISEDYETATRVEREIAERWTLFAEHQWERSRSNEIEFRYRVHTVLAGVQRSF
jgi:hypothetical protein